jgi:regulatory protein
MLKLFLKECGENSVNKYLFNSALQYLSRRPRSTKEVKDYLLKKLEIKVVKRRNGTVYILPKPNPEKQEFFAQQKEERKKDIEEILLKLQELKFLNDMDYAKWFIESRSRSNPKGWRLIMMELGQKGIDKEIVSSLSSLQNPGLGTKGINTWADAPRDEYQLALGLAQKKMKQLAGFDKQIIYRRLGGLLARRGFDLDTIRSVIDEVLGKSV